jgi:hypothetical protein
MVPGRVPDIFQVIVLAAGPNTFLGGDRPVILAFLIPGKNPFKLDHARIDKQKRRVVLGHKGGGPDLLVIVFFKVF